MSAALRRSVSSLQIPNYRRYFAGQLVSLSGNWMQTVAEMWLILSLTGSGVAVGVTAALQFLPMLLFGAWGGVIADRWPKRRLLVVTQTAMAVPALVLWGLTAGGAVEPWMVFGLVFARGAVNAVDNPTRQSFVIEMVGSDRVVNAVGLNSVLIHSARIFGPAGAGVLIATVGIAPCFLINAATFGAMIFALRSMDAERLRPAPLARPGDGGVLAALRYVRSEPTLAIPLAMMAVVGTLAFNFQVLLPLLGRFTFGHGAEAYTALAVAMAVGSVGGALFTGARGQVGERLLVGAAVAFGLFALLASAAPTLPVALVLLVPLGAASVTFAAGVNSTLQLRANPEMRGRVMALYSVVFLGSTPIGGPLVGWLAELAGPRAGLVLGGLAALAAAGGGFVAFARRRGADPLHRVRRLPEVLPDASRWRRWRPATRGAIAVETRGADQLDRLERRGGLDIEADTVAFLDRGDGGLASAPGQRDQDRVAGADCGDLRPRPAEDSCGERERANGPQADEGDPARAFGREAGRRPRGGEGVAHRLGRARRAPEREPGCGGEKPPAERDRQHDVVGLAVGDDDGDRR
ncbi:MAG TPA: MFS transporter [Solirubrobacterales bacterium]|nr:MFS transporter [Solirubrobacterales bacterium]